MYIFPSLLWSPALLREGSDELNLERYLESV